MTDLSDVQDLYASATGRSCHPISIRPKPSEWLDAFDAIIESEGRERATFILRKLLDRARAQRVALPPVLNTPYCNTDPARRAAAVSRAISTSSSG